MLKTLFFILITLLPIIGAGCSGNETRLVSEQPVIEINYYATFEGETASGNIYLVVEMEINNKGYSSFDTSPSNFAVEVENFSYRITDGDLPALDLPDSGNVSGRLIFEVPPQAASSRIGYQLTYNGQIKHEVLWVKLSNPIATSLSSEPHVDIVYSTTLMWLYPPGIDYLVVEPPGNLYLVVDLTIENRGYAFFNNTPEYFSLDVRSVLYTVPAKLEGQLIDWRVLEIPNSGKFEGSLVFLIPTEVAQSFYAWDYDLKYSGVRAYNINWMSQSVSEIFFEPAKSDLPSVVLTDGASVSGRITFFIPNIIAAANPSFQMLYDGTTTHNVQWFDQPGAVMDIDTFPISYPVIKITYSASLIKEETGQTYLMVDMLVENIGYASFYTSPGNFPLEVKYLA